MCIVKGDEESERVSIVTECQVCREREREREVQPLVTKRFSDSSS